MLDYEESPELQEFKECLDRIIKNDNYEYYSEKIWNDVQPEIVKGIKRSDDIELYFFEVNKFFTNAIHDLDTKYEQKLMDYHEYDPKLDLLKEIGYFIELMGDYKEYRITGKFPHYYNGGNHDERKLYDFANDYLSIPDKKKFYTQHLDIVKKRESNLYDEKEELNQSYNQIKDDNWAKHNEGKFKKEDENNESKILRDLNQVRNEYQHINQHEEYIETQIKDLEKQEYNPKEEKKGPLSKEEALINIGKYLREKGWIEIDEEELKKQMMNGGEVKLKDKQKYLTILLYHLEGRHISMEKVMLSKIDLRKVTYSYWKENKYKETKYDKIMDKATERIKTEAPIEKNFKEFLIDIIRRYHTDR
jgi:hypothetical protein